MVVSSKSGGTVETDSQRRPSSPPSRTPASTRRPHGHRDRPGQPAREQSRADGFRSSPQTLSAAVLRPDRLRLVPAALAGVDVGALLDDAEAVADILASDDADNRLILGAVLAGTAPSDKIMLVENGTPIVGFGDWPSSSSRSHRQERHRCAAGRRHPDSGTHRGDFLDADDITTIELVGDVEEAELSGASAAAVSGALGAQLLLWEAATAVAGRLLGINPFDQPDVESAKQAARELLDRGAGSTAAPLFVDGDVEIRVLPEDGAGDEWIGSATNLPDAVSALSSSSTRMDISRSAISTAPTADGTDTALPALAPRLSRATDRPVTFGWGPRFLHSTGQYHKGGPEQGVYIQITDDTSGEDLPVPGREFTFGEFIAAQAGGDAAVLGEHARPVLRLHITGPAGRDAVLAALSPADD